LGPTPTDSHPLRKWKGHVYEGGIRVPTIFFWQGQIAPQQVCHQYFTNTDYLPTFLELLGQTYSLFPDAKSFAPLLKNPNVDTKRGAIFWHYPHFSNQMGRPAGAVRLGDWKLVENYEDNHLELFNLAEDIEEAKDLSLENPQKKQELYQLLVNWRKEVNANMPIKK